MGPAQRLAFSQEAELQSPQLPGVPSLHSSGRGRVGTGKHGERLCSLLSLWGLGP